MLKRVLAVALAAAMIFGLVSVALAASPFPDTSGVEQEAAIAKLKALGLVKGDENGNYNPYKTINRAEFTTMVVRMLNLEAAASYLNEPTAFPDVTPQWAWAYGYINIAAGKGLVKGFDDGTFRPGEPVTQAQALTVLLRALGYNDNLPGNWPIDYVMKGAELGVIGGGFAGGIGATRAYVAEMIVNTLDQIVVKEVKDVPGSFEDKYTQAGTTLYKDAFGLRSAGQPTASVTGIASAYSGTNATITIGGTAYGYVSGVAIYGKDKIADLVGQTVTATLNKAGKVVFIEVTTAGEVAGKITAVDTVNNKVTVGGTQYALTSDVKIFKNGEDLREKTTIAGALVDIKNSDAKLLLNNDGKVYRIDASLLDLSGSVQAKQVTIDADGSVKNQIQVNGNWYTVTSATTIVRNGASATYADIKVGDEVSFSAKSDGKLVYVDLWYQVLEGYKVISYKVTSSGKVLECSKDGTVTTFKVWSKATFPATLTLNAVYDLVMNKAGEVKDVKPVDEPTPDVGVVRTVDSKDQYYDNGLKYRVYFTDGSSLVLSDLTFETVKKNGLDQGTSAKNVWDALSVRNLVRLEKGTGEQYKIYIYSTSLSGQLTRNASSSVFTLNIDGTQYLIDTDWDTEVTLNGKRVLNTLVEGDTTASDDFVATVTLTGTDKSGNPLASKVAVEKFDSPDAYPVKSITSTGSVYTFTLDNGTATPVTVKVYKDTIVMKDGVKVTVADIKIGDLVQASADRMYFAATTDDEEPEIAKRLIPGATDPDDPENYEPDVDVTWTPKSGDTPSKLVVTFTTSEPCAKGFVWVAGQQKAATFDTAIGKWTLEVSGLSEKPAVVTCAAQDYAGNVSEAVDVTVTP